MVTGCNEKLKAGEFPVDIGEVPGAVRAVDRVRSESAMQLTEGASASVEVVVTADMTATAYARRPGERYPAVLATPVMIGEMERAAAALLEPLLADGQLSVGVRVEVSHVSPTPIGTAVRSYATFAGREGTLFWFEVWSEDSGGTIGRGRHARVIVDVTTIEQKAASRHPTP